MRHRRIVCLSLCAVLLFSCAACKKSDPTDSNFSNTSVITEVYGNVEIVESDNTTISSQTDTTLQNSTSQSSTTSSQNETSSVSSNTSNASSQSVNKDVLAMLYGFSSIEKVNYYCVRNLPESDAIYAITDIITDAGTDICDSTSEILCDDKNIIVNQKTITVPRAYLKKHNSVTLSAYHSGTEAKYDFTINFEDEWNLLFEDQFNGTEINTEYWDYSPNYYRDKGYANTWKDECTFLDGKGHLVSRAVGTGEVNEEGKAICYSGALWSKDLFESSYGYYEVRAKLHHTNGMWGAFWLVCGDMDSANPADDNTGVNGCELDIFESLYNHGGVSHAIHWDGFKGYTKSWDHHGYITYIDT